MLQAWKITFLFFRPFFSFVGIMLSSLYLYHHVDARYRLFLVPTIGTSFFYRNLNVILKL